MDNEQKLQTLRMLAGAQHSSFMSSEAAQALGIASADQTALEVRNAHPSRGLSTAACVAVTPDAARKALDALEASVARGSSRPSPTPSE